MRTYWLASLLQPHHSLGSTVVVIDSVLVAVDGWLIIGGLMIGRSTVDRAGGRTGGGSGDTGENDESLQ